MSAKEKILQTARTMLWTQGYDGASVNDIVGKAGVSKGAFFHYYKTKNDVVRDVIDYYFNEQLYHSLDKHLGKTDSVKDGLLSWLKESYGAYAQWDFKGGCMLGNFALELSDTDEVMREHIKGHFIMLENMIVSHIRDKGEVGAIKMDARQFARLFIHAYQGVMMSIKVHKDAKRASRDFQALRDMVEGLVSI